MAIGFKIADGYVEVHAVVDNDRVRSAGRRAADDFDDEFGRRTRRNGEKNAGQWADGFFKGLFKVNPMLSRILPGWFEIAASPIFAAGFAAGLAWVSSFVAAVLSSGALLAVGAGIIALTAVALKENEKLKAEWEKTAKFAGDAFKRAAAPMLQPFINALGIFRGGISQIEPILTNIVRSISPAIEPLAQGLVGFLVNFLSGLEKAGPAVAEIMIAFAKELPDFGKRLGEFFMFLAEHKDEIIKGMQTVFTVMEIGLNVVAYTLVFLTAQFNATAMGWNAMTGAISKGVDWLKENVPAAFRTVVDSFKNAWSGGSDFFKNLWNDIISFLQGVWSSITSSFQTAWDGFTGALSAALENLRSTIWEPFWGAFGGLIKATWDFILSIINLAVASVQFTISWVMEFVKNTWSAGWAVVSAVAKDTWNDIKEFFTGVWNMILAVWNYIWDQIGGKVKGALNSIWNAITFTWNSIWKFTSSLWTTIMAVFTSILSNAWDKVKHTLNTIVNLIRGFYDYMRDAARRLIQGLIDGIIDKVQYVTNAINRITGIIKDHLPGSPVKMGPLSGDHEPRRGGQKIAQMIADGLTAGIPSVKTAINALVVPVGQKPDDTPPDPRDFGDGGFGGGVAITVNIKGVWDFTDPGAANQIAGKVHEAIENYKRGYGKKL